MAPNGRAQDDPARDGAVRDGAARNGAARNHAARNGAAHFLARAIATFGFVGLIPFGPGTWASAVTLALWIVLRMQPVAYWTALAAVCTVGTWAAHRAESIYGHDDNRVVIDEVAGSLIAVAFLPQSVPIALVAFLLFRFFDIVKPPPIYQIQSLPGGFGVMVDDVAAGIAANVVVRVIMLAAPALQR